MDLCVWIFDSAWKILSFGFVMLWVFWWSCLICRIVIFFLPLFDFFLHSFVCGCVIRGNWLWSLGILCIVDEAWFCKVEWVRKISWLLLVKLFALIRFAIAFGVRDSFFPIAHLQQWRLRSRVWIVRSKRGRENLRREIDRSINLREAKRKNSEN